MKYIFLILVLLKVNSYAQTDSTTHNSVQTNEDLCINVIIKTNKFTDETSYYSPITEDIEFIKVKSKDITDQYVGLTIYNTYLTGYDNHGLIILFKSGKKINRANEKIDVDYSSGSNWKYSAFFTPTEYEINLLKSEEIIGFELYIFSSDITEGNIIKTYANCILDSQKISVKKKN